MSITINIPGIPAPGGSKRGFVVGGRVRIVDACKRNAPWRAVVALAAKQQYQGPPLIGPLDVTFRFAMPRPKSHFRTGKRSNELRDDAPLYHTGAPDTTKLVRAAEDACTGILWVDDKQIALQVAGKVYDDRPGLTLTVSEIRRNWAEIVEKAGAEK